MNLEELREKCLNNGFSPSNVSAKLCQEIILSKISKSDMNQNITIKGGVVMYEISNDKRRATRDLDLDFIKYSLSEEAIKNFINKLNLINDEIEIYINGDMQELHHQDYKGKRINIVLRDKYNFSVSAKLDIGVHNYFDIYYLINNTNINKKELLNIINTIIINDITMRENNIDDIIKNLEITLNNNIFKKTLSSARNNWLNISIEEVVNNIINYFKAI